jgi:MinD-like ATPase involved in chromosome partitioning or flagellar assembly
MKPFWITFYSYKGGVGRSLALANTAALLVKRGRRVVLIDFDLEAPGLDSFEEFKSIAGKPGVVEYVSEFERTKRAPDIRQFLHACDLPGQLRGKLWITPAGKKDAAYNHSRNSLKWADLYESGLGEPFVENWKEAIARHCQPDYVLVDSRTGLTDVGGICTLHLPDLVVMVFGLNEQNVCGVAAVAKTIRESDITRVPQIHYVASPVPNLPPEKGSPLAERWADASTHLGTKINSSLYYQATAALSEKLFVLDEHFETTRLVLDYQSLLERLIDYNRSGLDFLSRQVKGAIADGDAPLMERLATILREEYPDRPEASMARAQLAQAAGDSATASATARQALDRDPTYATALEWLIKQYRRENKFALAFALCNSVIKAADRLPPATLDFIHLQRGETAMAAGEYADASASFDYNLDRERKKEKGGDPATTLVHAFNSAEALRRISQEPKPELWKKVIDLYYKAGEAATLPPIFQTNCLQAIHVAFAMTSDTPRAREALLKARHAAELLGPAEDIFTVKNYTNVSVKEWITINDEMLAALDRGQLWDGMPIPAANLT